VRSAFICFALAFSSGRKRSLIRTAPSGRDSDSTSRRPSIRRPWMLPPPMSSPNPSWIVVEFATASQP
jgi:hypothetical protein